MYLWPIEMTLIGHKVWWWFCPNFWYLFYKMYNEINDAKNYINTIQNWIMVLESSRYDVPTYLVLFFFTFEKLIRETDISFLRDMGHWNLLLHNIKQLLWVFEKNFHMMNPRGIWCTLFQTASKTTAKNDDWLEGQTVLKEAFIISPL